MTEELDPSSQVDHANLSRVVWAVLSVVSSPSSAVRRIMVATILIMIIQTMIVPVVFTCKEEEETTCRVGGVFQLLPLSVCVSLSIFRARRAQVILILVWITKDVHYFSICT